MKCARANGMATRAMFEQTCSGDPEYGSCVKLLKPEATIGNTSRRTSELELEEPQGTARAVTTIVEPFILSQAHLLMLESTPYLLKSATSITDLAPLLWTAGYCWEAIEMSTQQAGVPSTKRRILVDCV